MPAVNGARVVNLYVRNESSFLGLFSNPVKAHTGHAANRAIWEVVLGQSNLP
jgi:hypothetical protein